MDAYGINFLAGCDPHKITRSYLSISLGQNMETTFGSTLPKVLVVDDEEGVIKVLRRVLQFECEFYSAENVQHALETMDREGPFAVVLTDYRMPGENGTELVLRGREKFPDTVFMMLTGNQDEQADTAIQTVQPFLVLTKPCEMVAIRNAVSEATELYENRLAASN